MTQSENLRIDEVRKYYEPAAKVEGLCVILFWVIASFSLFIPYSLPVIGESLTSCIQILFLLLVLSYFVLSQVSRFYLAPRAERQRRKQLLSNSFGTVLSHDRTAKYYNNPFPPSIGRLGANVFENSFFSKELSCYMLRSRRIFAAAYLAIWVGIFAIRYSSIEVLTWITQIVFSSEILAGWITLEMLRSRQERTFEQLQAHYLHGLSDKSPEAIATILDAFAEYEAAKSGVLLSSSIFKKYNPLLSAKWESIKQNLKMVRLESEE